MTFNFFSLDYIYYPVSAIMWFWHKVFGFAFGMNNAWAWVLSVVFLVFTLRAILFKPYLKQLDSQLKMQAVQPEMKKLREKYKDDRQRLTEEMMKLNKEHGVNPLSSCGPALIQAPVFIGLFHVLRMFQPIPNGSGGYTLRDQVYFFGSSDVHSFAFAKLFGGAPLGGSMRMPLDQLLYLGGDRATIIAVGVPLTILAGIATHMTSRRSVARQHELNPEGTSNSQTKMMNKLMLYLFPLFVVVGGPFFPLAILFYWLSNNTWTFGQLWVAHRMQDRKRQLSELVVEEAKESTRYSTPKPGARPTKDRPLVQPSRVNDGSDGPASDGAQGGGPGGPGGPSGPASGTAKPRTQSGPAKGGTPAGTAKGGGASTNGSASASSKDGASNGLPPGMISDSSRPKPGARPTNPRSGNKRKPKR